MHNVAHFNSIAKCLREPRVGRVVESVIVVDESFPEGVSSDDAGYVVDLGIQQTDSARERYWPASPIYGEVVARRSSWDVQQEIPKDFANK